jgi:uncharacterized protein
MMRSMSQYQDYQPNVPEETVVAYLRRHPEFFFQHQELLAQLKIPHRNGTAVSLVERQVKVLRDENKQLQRKLANLIEMAQRNEQLSQRIQRVVFRLTGITQADAFFDALYAILAEEFLTDAITLRLFEMNDMNNERPEFVAYDAEIFNLFEYVLKSGHPLCGRLSLEQHEYLFSQGKIGSAALIPLGTPQPYGILALGSTDVARYHSGMATDLLKHLGDLITALLRPCLKPAPVL